MPSGSVLSSTVSDIGWWADANTSPSNIGPSAEPPIPHSTSFRNVPPSGGATRPECTAVAKVSRSASACTIASSRAGSGASPGARNQKWPTMRCSSALAIAPASNRCIATSARCSGSASPANSASPSWACDRSSSTNGSSSTSRRCRYWAKRSAGIGSGMVPLRHSMVVSRHGPDHGDPRRAGRLFRGVARAGLVRQAAHPRRRRVLPRRAHARTLGHRAGRQCQFVVGVEPARHQRLRLPGGLGGGVAAARLSVRVPDQLVRRSSSPVRPDDRGSAPSWSLHRC
jgi:hypothetical protein